MTHSNENARVQADSLGCAITFEIERTKSTPPPVSIQPQPNVDDFQFTCDLVKHFGAGRFVSVARYVADGQSQIEIFEPLPRGWQDIILPLARYRRALRVRWRNSRGCKLHSVDFRQIGELVAELAKPRAAPRASR